jgi:hypothetical protein
VRRYRLLPKYGLGDLPNAKRSPTVVCQKAIILIAGFSVVNSHLLVEDTAQVRLCVRRIISTEGIRLLWLVKDTYVLSLPFLSTVQLRSIVDTTYIESIHERERGR